MATGGDAGTGISHGPVTVVVRTRPTPAFASEHFTVESDTGAITAVAGRGGGARAERFAFHRVLHNANQEEVYAACGRDLVTHVVKGMNATVLAYGQTGAGKTHTILGDPLNYRNRGIAPRAIAQLFAQLADKPELEVSVAVSYMEIYQERIHDLLEKSHFARSARASTVGHAAPPASAVPPDFAIVDDPEQGTTVRGLTQVPVSTEEAALQALFAGETARITGEHVLNAKSNRSHCIFTLHVRQRARLGGGRERIIVSKLNLVDLAGSERIAKTLAPDGASPHPTPTTSSSDTLARESRAINQSLSYLEQCVVALARASATGRATHVPYRQSKLTSVLKDALGGACHTVFIAAVWPEERHLEESMSTLRLAARMMQVQNEAPAMVVTYDPAELVKKYEREVALLRRELALHDALTDRTGVVYGEHTPEQTAALAAKLRAYFNAPDTADVNEFVPLSSVSQMLELLRQAKLAVRVAGVEAEERLRERYTLVPKPVAPATGGGDTDASYLTTAASAAGAASMGGAPTSGMSGLGELDRGAAGLSLGIAPAQARPASMSALSGAGRSGVGRPGSTAMEGSRSGSGSPILASITPPPPPSRSASPGRASPIMAGAGPWSSPSWQVRQAWARFRDPTTAPPDAVHAATALVDARARAVSLRANVVAAAKAVNAAKAAIDGLHSGGPVAVGSGKDRDGDASLQQARLMEAKARYRAAHAAHETAHHAYTNALVQVEVANSALLSLFSAHASTLGLEPVAADWAPRAGTAMESKSAMDHGGDTLDEAEAFERLERERVAAVDPDSLAYFSATRKLRQAATSILGPSAATSPPATSVGLTTVTKAGMGGRRR